MAVPNIFANASSPLPLSQLDTNFATPITLGSTAVALGNTVTSVTGLNTTGTAANVTGTVALANGGTGQTTQAAALTALAGTQVSGRYLRSDGANTALSAIQAADVPTLNQNTTGTASNVTGTVAIANGGTGQTTQAAALTALAGAQTSGRYLRSDGTNTTLAAIQAADVPTLNQNTTGTAANVTGTVAATNGGTGSIISSISNGTLLIGNSFNSFSSNTLTAGAGVKVTNGFGSITVAHTGSTINDQTGTGTYYLVAGDAGKTITTDNVGNIVVNTATMSAGNFVTVVNNSSTSGAQITPNTGMTIHLAGTSTGGTRTLALWGTATIIFISSTVAVISGQGLT